MINMNIVLPYERKEKVALAIYDSKPTKEEIIAGKKPAFLTASDLGIPSFVYTSGRLGDYYSDMRVVPSFPTNFKTILDQLFWQLERIGMEKFDGIVSTESAGISWGQSVANRFELPFTYGRKEPKTHGTKKFVEGHVPNGARLLEIEDLNNTLSSIRKTVFGVRAEGGVVAAVDTIFDRMQYAKQDLDDLGVPLASLINIYDFVEIGEKTGRLDSTSATSILQYHTDEGVYAKKIVSENLDYFKNHSSLGKIIAGYEEIYRKTGNENFKCVLALLKGK